MSTRHLEPNTDTDSALDDNLPPEQSAQIGDELPENGEGDNRDQDDGESWDDVNSRLRGADQADDQDDKDDLSELQKLKAELESERKARETAEKRMKDSQKAFRERSEELKRIREEQELAKGSDQKTQDLQADVASGKVAAPQSQGELNDLVDEYGLTEEEKEVFDLYPEFKTAMDKILSKRLDTGLSEREKAKEMAEKEARARQLEAELNAEEEAKWLNGVKKAHPDADRLLSDASFNAWLQSNDALRASILAEKEKYDPSGLVEIIDLYKDQKADIDRVRARRSYGRQASVSPTANTGAKSRDAGEKTWAQINAELKKKRSR